MLPVGPYRRLFVVSGMSTVFDTALMRSVGNAARDQAPRAARGAALARQPGAGGRRGKRMSCHLIGVPVTPAILP
jgi:hypothetical protein